MSEPVQESAMDIVGGSESKTVSEVKHEDESTSQAAPPTPDDSSKSNTGDEGSHKPTESSNETTKPNKETAENNNQTQEKNPDDDETKRKHEGASSGEEPATKKPKTEEVTDETATEGTSANATTTEATPLEKAQQAAERARISMLPELDPQQVTRGSGLPKHQHKYALSAIRAIKRLKDAMPFVAPVDPVRQGVPQYFDYIKHPMDLGTMEKKLVDGKYDSIKEIVDDFNLIVSNCIVFNGEEALISKMGLSIAQSFKKQLSNMPTFDATRKGSQAAAAAAAAATATPPAATVTTPAAAAASSTSATAASSTAAPASAGAEEDNSALHDDHIGKRASTTTTILGPNGLPMLRRKSTIDGRPKREIRPPRHPGSFVGSGTGEGRPRNKKYASELRFAGQVLREMQGRKLESISFPFLLPVDPIEQGVPTYFDVIKEPMDLSTIQRKLTEGIYYNAEEFESDIRLMFRNCYTFNPEGTPVNVMGHKLEAYFDSRWVEKPIPGSHNVDESDVSDVDEEYAESGMANPAIDVLEEQLKLIRKQLKRLKKDALAEYYKRGHRRSANPKRRRSSTLGSGSGSGGHGVSAAVSKPLPTEMTYEMKRELRDKIDKLPEKKIRTVIAIIQESMPDLGNNGQDEIELEVDALDTITLLRLYNYAVLGRREEPGAIPGAQSNGNTHGVSASPTATGSSSLAAESDAAAQSSKRRSKALSEEEHVRKIAEIESKLKEFDSVSGTPNASTAVAAGSAASAVTAADSDSSDDDQFESDDSSSEEE